jgi:hypothetical protein
MEYFKCFNNSCLKLMGFKVFEPKMYFDYDKTLAMGIYDNNVIFLVKNGDRKYRLINIVKINDFNYKLFFTDYLSRVIVVSIHKKTTYLLIEIVDCFFSYQKSLIVDSNYSKSLYIFFDWCRNKQLISNIDDSNIQEFIGFLHFRDIYW